MPERRFPALATHGGTRLTGAEYLAEFQNVFPTLTSRFDKLEVGQDFDESGYPPFDAHVRGDREHARALLEEERPALAAKHADQTRRGMDYRRLRVVCEPLTDYVRWEAGVLNLRAQYGERIRVITLNEHPPPIEFPEFVILGDTHLFVIEYEDGALAGACLYTDRSVITDCRDRFDALYAHAEEFTSWYTRAIG